IWFAMWPLYKLAGCLVSCRERKRIRQSFTNSLVGINGRDSFRYYENGRWVTVRGELMSGSADVDRVIYRQCPLRWNDTGETLTTAERERVFQKVTEHLDQSGIKWKFDDGRSEQT